MFDNILQGVYDKLKPNADKTKENVKAIKIFLFVSLILFAVGSIILFPIVLFWNLNFFVSDSVWISVWIISFLLSYRFLNKGFKKYNLTVDEWSIFLPCSILKNLEDYSEANKKEKQELKKEYKKMAVQDAKDFLITINDGWMIGDFRLAREIREAVSKFKDNLQTRLIPNLEKLDMKVFDRVESAVYTIAHVMLTLDLPKLNNLNDSTFQQLDEYSPSKMKRLSNWWKYLQAHRIPQHILALTVIGILAFSSFLVLWHEGATIDTTYGTPFIVFSTLAAAYIATALIKGEPPKTSGSK